MASSRPNMKTDENDMRMNKQRKGNVAGPNKNIVLPELKRPALGEVGNIVRNIESGAAYKESLNQLKPSVGMFKGVKSKVDSHWKKSALPTANVKRANSIPTAPKLVTTKTVQVAKPEVAKKVTIKLDGPCKKLDSVSQSGTIKRQESIVSRRSIPFLRNTTAQHGKPNSSQHRSDDVRQTAVLPNDVDDIDENDNAKLILASEYVKDIYAYLHQLERKFAIRENHLDSQKDVTRKMRAVLIDWINEVHLQFGLITDTYYLTVSIIDRFLQTVSTTSRKHLQLVGVTALFIASKYEEMYPPAIKDFAFITDDTYTVEQIIAMEKYILKKLGFNLSPPLVIHFLRRFAKAARTVTYDESLNKCSVELTSTEYCVAKYLVELASIECSLVSHLPSAIAAAGIFMSMKLFSKPVKSNDEIWTATLQHYTTHSLTSLYPIVRIIANIALNAPEAKEQSVYKRYAMEQREQVALRSEMYGSVMKEFCKL